MDPIVRASELPLGHLLPVWSVAPFALVLAGIAILPLAAGRFWEHNRNKLLFSALLGVPVVALVARLDGGAVAHAAHEYVAFMALLGALYVISGGIVVRGTLSGTPGLNAALLGAGAALASLVGTTGASMLLVRPLLRANSVRRGKAHVFVFFIFIVANAGGLLTPLGDPPLFLGFLRGVPFTWTLRLWREWAFVVGALLLVFYVVDSTLFRREDLATPGDLDELAEAHRVPLHVAGAHNALWLAAIVGVLVVAGTLAPPPGVAEAALAGVAALAWVTTPAALRRENRFSWGPILEVAALFAGIFATMIPALAILNARGAELGLAEPWQYFWATGALSSVLDNAPTYLTFASAASAVVGTDAGDLSQLVAHARGAGLLRAVSLGAVLMGAATYIGNGPNFMVKTIAEEGGVRMPSFFGYLAWSAAVLLPILAAMSWLFLM
ncbi:MULTISPECIES: sodium:proton antiporter [Anaeromyxobacter]|uniref:sodium:proton antiporter n=1 Tax=Anaeromyxobacter TaxID=161492 RepID=UPI001F563E5B|nr:MULTISPECIES: sodium:proton antiporter [unclassified Anaeromyxobacter]